MSIRKHSIVLSVLLSFCVTIVTPVAQAYASPLTDVLSHVAANSTSNSGNSLTNIILGLVMGKLFGNVSNNGALPDTSKVLGASIHPDKDMPSGESIVASGKKYIGTPYVWGGETPEGFDCSGFTQYVMKRNGIDIPRTAAEQFAAGIPVAKKNLQVGDLVFFTTYKPGASHVGFYMGNTQFLQASSAHKEVTISSLDEPYFKAHYIGARRYTS